MINVSIPPHFIPERTYIIRTLLTHYLGIHVDIDAVKGQLHTEIAWEGRTIIIEDHFFGQTIVGESYLSPDRIPKKVTEASTPGLDKNLILFGQDGVDIQSHSIRSKVDLFAGAFFMLTRWEEAVNHEEDIHGRFPAEKSLLVRAGQILRPLVDEYVALLRVWFLALGYPVPESTAQYTVRPTCDVDTAFYWLRKPRWKFWLNTMRQPDRLHHLREARRHTQGVRQGEIKDPYDQYDYMMDLCEANGQVMDFNILCGGLSRFEGFYSIHDPLVQQLLQRIEKRGHRIGLHPSYNTFLDVRQIREEKKKLEDVVGHPVTSSRQHYLKWSTPATWRHLSDAGLQEDSTLGYAAQPGFRCGTSKAYPVFDVYQREELPIMELPLLIMDVSLRHYLKLTPEAAITLCDRIIAEVKKHHGQLVFIWHNSNLSEVDGWKDWAVVFERLVKGSPSP